MRTDRPAAGRPPRRAACGCDPSCSSRVSASSAADEPSSPWPSLSLLRRGECSGVVQVSLLDTGRRRWRKGMQTGSMNDLLQTSPPKLDLLLPIPPTTPQPAEPSNLPVCFLTREPRKPLLSSSAFVPCFHITPINPNKLPNSLGQESQGASRRMGRRARAERLVDLVEGSLASKT